MVGDKWQVAGDLDAGEVGGLPLWLYGGYHLSTAVVYHLVVNMVVGVMVVVEVVVVDRS